MRANLSRISFAIVFALTMVVVAAPLAPRNFVLRAVSFYPPARGIRALFTAQKSASASGPVSLRSSHRRSRASFLAAVARRSAPPLRV